MSPLNVLHIITGLGQGGAETMLLKLLSAMQTHCDAQVVSMMDEGVYGRTIEKMGIPLHCLRMRKGVLSPRAVWRLWEILKTVKPDVVQTWMYHGDLIGGGIAKLAGIQNIFWNVRHSNLDKDVNSLSTRIAARLSAALSGTVPSGIVVNSHRGRDTHQQIGYAGRKMIVIPNAFDLTAYHVDRPAGQAFRSAVGIDQDLPVLGMAARFHPQKDHLTLLRALRMVADESPRFCALLCGGGIDASNTFLQSHIRELRLESQIQLLGPQSEMPHFMNALDFHVLSSCGEGFPNVLGEAMACGTPCVTTDTGDSAEIVGDTGWVVPPRDPKALAHAILEALSESQTNRIAQSQRCRQRIIENYEISHVANAYLTLWNYGLPSQSSL